MFADRKLRMAQIPEIRPVPRPGIALRNVYRKHGEVSNGLLMRSDLHRLLDDGYLTIDPVEHRVLVSKQSKKNLRTGGITTAWRAYGFEIQSKPGRN